MAGTAKGDEVFFHIASKEASRLPVMDLEILGSHNGLLHGWEFDFTTRIPTDLTQGR